MYLIDLKKLVNKNKSRTCNYLVFVIILMILIGWASTSSAVGPRGLNDFCQRQFDVAKSVIRGAVKLGVINQSLAAKWTGKMHFFFRLAAHLKDRPQHQENLLNGAEVINTCSASLNDYILIAGRNGFFIKGQADQMIKRYTGLLEQVTNTLSTQLVTEERTRQQGNRGNDSSRSRRKTRGTQNDGRGERNRRRDPIPSESSRPVSDTKTREEKPSNHPKARTYRRRRDIPKLAGTKLWSNLPNHHHTKRVHWANRISRSNRYGTPRAHARGTL